MVQDAMHAEPLPAGDAELVAFAGRLMAGGELAPSDLPMIRVLEDLIDLLVERSVIRFTDLPQPAQEKLVSRRSARQSLRRLNLLGDEGGLL
jgi:hypothetical protein